VPADRQTRCGTCPAHILERMAAIDPDELKARQIASEVYLACKQHVPVKQGFCRFASEVMRLKMEEAGLEGAVCLVGDYANLSDDNGHVWVEWRDLVFDARAEQFNPQAPLVRPKRGAPQTPWETTGGDPAGVPEQTGRSQVAETIATLMAWDNPRWARSYATLADALGISLDDVEEHLLAEFDLAWGGDDIDRFETWTVTRASLGHDIDRLKQTLARALAETAGTDAEIHERLEHCQQAVASGPLTMSESLTISC
jgi:hypothetical protein